MLDKLGGIYAPRPSSGPHKVRECLPLIMLLRNRLKYALTRREVGLIMAQRCVLVDKKVRTDMNFPAGFMDVVEITKTGDRFRIFYDAKGRFTIVKIPRPEGRYKLCRVMSVKTGDKGIPYIVTHDGRTIRYPHPEIKVNDTVVVGLKTGKIYKFVSFQTGCKAIVTGGRNTGRIGKVLSREKHPGSFDLVHLRDSKGQIFSTRISNVFILGAKKSLVTLPKNNGIKSSLVEDRRMRIETTAH